MSNISSDTHLIHNVQPFLQWDYVHFILVFVVMAMLIACPVINGSTGQAEHTNMQCAVHTHWYAYIHTHIHTAHNNLQITEMQVCHNVICQTHTSSCRLQVQHDTASYCEKSACGNRQHCSWNVKIYHHTFHRLTVSWLSVPLTHCRNNPVD